jgi:putative flippase GtrA
MFLKTKVKTAFLYVGFAIISTVVNLLSQYVSFLIYSGFLSLYFAMSVGTLSGLVVKYILDKRFIFFTQQKAKKITAKSFYCIA